MTINSPASWCVTETREGRGHGTGIVRVGDNCALAPRDREKERSIQEEGGETSPTSGWLGIAGMSVRVEIVFGKGEQTSNSTFFSPRMYAFIHSLVNCKNIWLQCWAQQCWAVIQYIS